MFLSLVTLSPALRSSRTSGWHSSKGKCLVVPLLPCNGLFWWLAHRSSHKSNCPYGAGEFWFGWKQWWLDRSQFIMNESKHGVNKQELAGQTRRYAMNSSDTVEMNTYNYYTMRYIISFFAAPNVCLPFHRSGWTSFILKWHLSFVFPQHSRMVEGKEKDDPKTIPLKIFAKDIGNCAYVRASSFLVLLQSAQK